MIVKNEERFLPTCLASVSGVVDEIVVLDTGSTDRTCEIALAAGATLAHFEWCDDFSAARNAALKHVTSDWVLVLDADEVLANGAGAALRAALNHPGMYCGMLPMHHSSRVNATQAEVLSGEHRMGEPTWLPRLFLKTDDLAWEGIVHESPSGWLEARGGVGTCIQSPIVHFGSVPDFRDANKRDLRNLSLLRKEVAADPDCWMSKVYLACTLHTVGEKEEAIVIADAAWTKIMQELPATIAHANSLGSPLKHMPTGVVKGFTVFAQILIEKSAFQACLTLVATALELGVDHPNTFFIAGVCYENMALTDTDNRMSLLVGAKNSYGAALEYGDRPMKDAVLDGASSWKASLRLATVLLQLGEQSRSIELFQSLKDQESELAILGISEALIGMNKPVEALNLLRGVIEQHDSVDGQILAAHICLQLGETASFQTLLQCAYNGVKEGLKETHRLKLLNELLGHPAQSIRRVS
jgi:hypothetical protein